MGYRVVVTRRNSGSMRQNRLSPFRVRLLSTGHNGTPTECRQRRVEALKEVRLEINALKIMDEG